MNWGAGKKLVRRALGELGSWGAGELGSCGARKVGSWGAGKLVRRARASWGAGELGSCGAMKVVSWGAAEQGKWGAGELELGAGSGRARELGSLELGTPTIGGAGAS